MTTPATLLWFWDYDTQWGADRSRNPHRVPAWGPLEFANTDGLLELHARYAIPACFAVVGAAALPGDRPYHDPAQVRRMHAAGHEVASHSFRHEWLPGLTGPRLRETLVRSRDALQQCIGHRVDTFVPPFNQPFDHPRGMSFSLSERREAWGRRTGLSGLCAALAESGYRMCRVVYRSLPDRARERLGGTPVERPGRIEPIAGLSCVRLNTRGGFGDDTRSLLHAGLPRGGVWVVYGHPHSASDPASSQSFQQAERLMAELSAWRNAGLVRCVRPRDLLDKLPTGAPASDGGGVRADAVLPPARPHTTRATETVA